MMTSDCVFCRIVAGELPGSVVYRDDTVTVLLDIRPINPGHSLVIPNRHAGCLAELEEAVAGELFRVARRVSLGLRASGLRCEGVNLLLADGEAAGQEVPHVHLHVVPRFAGDGFGFRFPPDRSVQPGRADLDGVADMVRSALEAAGP